MATTPCRSSLPDEEKQQAAKSPASRLGFLLREENRGQRGHSNGVRGLVARQLKFGDRPENGILDFAQGRIIGTETLVLLKTPQRGAQQGRQIWRSGFAGQVCHLSAWMPDTGPREGSAARKLLQPLGLSGIHRGAGQALPCLLSGLLSRGRRGELPRNLSGGGRQAGNKNSRYGRWRPRAA